MPNFCLGYTVLSRGKICSVLIYGKIIGWLTAFLKSLIASSNDIDITMINYFFQFLFKLFFSTYLDQNCPLYVISFLFMLSRMCHGVTAEQCPTRQPIHGTALKGYTFKTLLNLSSLECLYYCHDEIRCQSYNLRSKRKYLRDEQQNKGSKTRLVCFRSRRPLRQTWST